MLSPGICYSNVLSNIKPARNVKHTTIANKLTLPAIVQKIGKIMKTYGNYLCLYSLDCLKEKIRKLHSQLLPKECKQKQNE